MHSKSWVVGIAGALVAAAAAGWSAAGCSSEADNCERAQDCPTASSSSSGTGGGNPACEAGPTEDPGAVIDACGVFVSANAAPGGDGTKAKPFASFAEAAASSPKRVYACAESYAESNGVSFSGGVEIYAGFTACNDADAGWTWSADAKATLNGPSDAVALALQSGDNRVRNLDVVAPDAVAEGASSIALLIEGGSLAMQNGNITAGAAKDGANGESLAADTALNGTPGNNGSDACMGDMIQGNPGGPTTTTMCAGGEMTVGGKGGDGGKVDSMTMMALAAGDGEDGQPAGVGGQHGTGEPEAGAWSCIVSPGQGGANPGAPGDNGSAALGAADTALGTLSATGFVPADGEAGMPGKPGQGGGGGGGAKGGLICNAGANYGLGASGGSGGTGGCGGAAGGAGKGGGASIAVVSLGAEVTFTEVTLTAGNAGNGGKGGNGQPGGTGGAASKGGDPAGTSKAACDGGKGGQGGVGGPGGGGRGGHSIGIAYTGAMPTGATIASTGTPGQGGEGGVGNEVAGQGATGVAAEMLAFE